MSNFSETLDRTRSIVAISAKLVADSPDIAVTNTSASTIVTESVSTNIASMMVTELEPTNITNASASMMVTKSASINNDKNTASVTSASFATSEDVASNVFSDKNEPLCCNHVPTCATTERTDSADYPAPTICKVHSSACLCNDHSGSKVEELSISGSEIINLRNISKEDANTNGINDSSLHKANENFVKNLNLTLSSQSCVKLSKNVNDPKQLNSLIGITNNDPLTIVKARNDIPKINYDSECELTVTQVNCAQNFENKVQFGVDHVEKCTTTRCTSSEYTELTDDEEDVSLSIEQLEKIDRINRLLENDIIDIAALQELAAEDDGFVSG